MHKSWLIFSAVVSFYCWYKYDARKKKLLAEHPEVFAKNLKELETRELFYYNTDRSDKKFFAGIAAAAIVIGIWGGVWAPYRANQETSSQYIAYVSSFDKGWNEYCDEIFDFSLGSISPNGILYAGSQSFTSGWCKGLRNTSDSMDSANTDDIRGMAQYSDVAGATKQGEDAGYRKSREKIFSMVPYLCYGTECISNSSEESRIIDSNLSDWRAGLGND